MYPNNPSSTLSRRGFPRTRGDVPCIGEDEHWQVMFPPHTRGCTLLPGVRGRFRGVSPAHAGMYRNANTDHIQREGFPRTRGDVPLEEEVAILKDKFPPHTRGCTFSAAVIFALTEVSPAHAGMYRSTGNPISRAPGFPRTRGDVPIKGAKGIGPKTFPPHTRGCTIADDMLALAQAVSPAHAGMYRTTSYHLRFSESFPRTRGDVPLDFS